MQPLTVIFGIVLGSAFSIAFGLGIVLLIFGLRHAEDSRYALELPELATASILFSVVSVVSALAFLGSLRGTAWRHWAALALAAVLLVVGFYYWPD
jgi:Ca2+/Na+ antiporter